MDKALNYLALARKAGKIELGEEPVGAAARDQKAHLIVVASDASDHTWRRSKSFAAGTRQCSVRIPFTKEEMGFIVGRTSLAIAAFTDAPMALAFLQSLDRAGEYQEATEILQEKTERVKKHQAEAKAHVRNIHKGKANHRGGGKK